MATYNPLPTQKPTAPKTPKSPVRPMSPHHNLPTPVHPQKLPAPQPAPKPQPLRGPRGPFWIVAVEEITKKLNCILRDSIPCGKEFPKRENDKKLKPRRQRPCSGGEPEKTEEEKKVKIGRIKYTTLTAITPRAQRHLLERELKELANKAGYDSKREGLKAVAELDGPKGFRENLFAATTMGDKPCFYQCYVIEKRIKCTCPDGSPCRKTRRD